MSPDEPISWFEHETPLEVPHRELTRIPLVAANRDLHRAAVDRDSIRFTATGWYEVLLTVSWDPSNTVGRRFAHTAIPDSHPLHSEAIEADVLAALSNGRQLLRGNTVFDPHTSVRSIALEVWQDSGGPVTVRTAQLGIRPLGSDQRSTAP